MSAPKKPADETHAAEEPVSGVIRVAPVIDMTKRRDAAIDAANPMRACLRANQTTRDAVDALEGSPSVGTLDAAESSLDAAYGALRYAKRCGWSKPELVSSALAILEEDLLVLHGRVANQRAAIRPARIAPVVSLAAARLRRGASAPAIRLTDKQARALEYFAIPAASRRSRSWDHLRARFASNTTAALERLGLVEWRLESRPGHVLTALGALVYESRIAAGEHFATVAPESST